MPSRYARRPFSVWVGLLFSEWMTVLSLFSTLSFLTLTVHLCLTRYFPVGSVSTGQHTSPVNNSLFACHLILSWNCCYGNRMPKRCGILVKHQRPVSFKQIIKVKKCRDHPLLLTEIWIWAKTSVGVQFRPRQSVNYWPPTLFLFKKKMSIT